MKNNIKVLSNKYASIILMCFILITITIFLSIKEPYFLTLKNFINILEANSYKMILAIGMTFIIASGAIDLSVGSIISLSAIVMGISMKSGVNVFSGILIGITLGIILGLFNGTIIHLTSINSLIITLATSSIFRGLSLILTRGTPITKFDSSFLYLGTGDLFGMEPGVFISIVILVIAIPLMYSMKWGNYLKTLGGNEKALKRTGVRTGWYRVSSYMYMGVMASIVGIIITARLNSAEPNAGLGMELDAVTAVIMGGTPLSGGKASLAGTVIAVFLLGLIRNGLTVMSVSSFYQQFVMGLILLFAILIAEIKEHKTV
ncbi:Ribose import permease protein RbsC [Terrisporobacter petrolearius]|uniref:ABC transporter permease n=1 Tax=Terrisporobacter petrolearius TaxID=1460447 RepID=UPI0033668FDF